MKRYLIGLMMFFSVFNAYAGETIQQSHDAFYTKFCERFIACGTHPNVAEMASLAQIKDVASCKAVLIEMDSAKRWESLLESKSITHNPKMTESCLEGIASLSCKSASHGVKNPEAIKGCEAFVVGTVELGASCSKHMECKSGTLCAGTCQKPQLLSCGEELCSESQVCDAVTQHCIAPKKVGEACANFSECETWNCGEAGKCGPLATVSEPGGSCEAGFVCSLGEACSGKSCKPY